jgi:hypothetical protein
MPSNTGCCTGKRVGILNSCVSRIIRILNETRRTTANNIIFTVLENSDDSSAGVRVEFWFPEIRA